MLTGGCAGTPRVQHLLKCWLGLPGTRARPCNEKTWGLWSREEGRPYRRPDDTAHLTPLLDVISNLVHYGQASDVESVMVDGEWIMKDGKVLTMDEAAVTKAPRKLPYIPGATCTRSRLISEWRRSSKIC